LVSLDRGNFPICLPSPGPGEPVPPSDPPDLPQPPPGPDPDLHRPDPRHRAGGAGWGPGRPGGRRGSPTRPPLAAHRHGGGMMGLRSIFDCQPGFRAQTSPSFRHCLGELPPEILAAVRSIARAPRKGWGLGGGRKRIAGSMRSVEAGTIPIHPRTPRKPGPEGLAVPGAVPGAVLAGRAGPEAHLAHQTHSSCEEFPPPSRTCNRKISSPDPAVTSRFHHPCIRSLRSNERRRSSLINC